MGTRFFDFCAYNGRYLDADCKKNAKNLRKIHRFDFGSLVYSPLELSNLLAK